MADTLKSAWDKIKAGASWMGNYIQENAAGIWDAAKDLFKELGSMSFEAATRAYQSWFMSIYPQLQGAIMEKLTKPITDIAQKITGQLDEWGITPPESWRNWLDVSADLSGFIKGILGKYRKTARPQDIAAGAGQAYATHRLSAEIVHESIVSIAYKDIAASEEIVKYVSELHEAHIEAPPVTPPNMPDIPNIVFNPPGHPWFKEWIGLEKVQESIEGVWHGIMTIMSRIKDIFIGLYNWIMETLTKSINTIITGVSNIGTYIATGVTQLAGVIWDSVREGASWVVSGLQNIWGSMTKWIQSIVLWIWQVIQGAYTWVWETTKSLGKWLIDQVCTYLAYIGDAFQAAGRNIYDALKWTGDHIIALDEVIRDAILVDFPNMLVVLGSKIAALPDAMLSINKKTTKYFVELLTLGLVGDAKILLWWITSTYEALMPVFCAIVDYVRNTLIPEIQKFCEPELTKIKDIAVNAKDGIVEKIMQFRPMTPEKVPEAAGWILGSAIGFGMIAHGISVVTELVHPLKSMGVHYLAGFMGDMGNFSVIATAVMGTLVYTAIRQPYSHYVNAMFRTNIPDETLLNAMRAKREITKPQFDQFMRYHGYPEWILDALERYIWMDPRLFEVIRIAEITSPPTEIPDKAAQWLADADIELPRDEDWWYYMKFGKAGYDDIDLPVLADASSFAVKRREQTMFLMRVRTAYREGLMDGKQAYEYLKDAGLRDDVAEFRMKSMFEELRQAMAGDVKSDLTYKFREDLITEDVFLSGLLYAGFLEDKANYIIYREKLRKQTKVSREVKKELEKTETEFQRAQQKLYREQFRKGLIDADTYENNLNVIGFLPEMASITVAIEVAGRYEDPEITRQKEAAALMKKIQKERIAKYKLMFRAQMISKSELIAYMIAAGMNTTYALAVANTEEARMFAPPKPELTES